RPRAVHTPWAREFAPVGPPSPPRRARQLVGRAIPPHGGAGLPELAADPFPAVVLAASVAAGAISAVAGFGIGSVLTPVVATRYDLQLAVAAVSLPHVVGTAVRFAMLRRHIDRHVLVRFGIPSALGGLAGATLQ